MNIKNLDLKGGRNTPRITFNSDTGILKLAGKSIPENASKVYAPLLTWISEYITDSREETNFHIDLDYFNTSTTIWLGKIIKLLSSSEDPSKLLLIHLYFNVEDFEEMDNEDLAEAISPLTDPLHESSTGVGVKVYSKDDSGNILKEKLILL